MTEVEYHLIYYVFLFIVYILCESFKLFQYSIKYPKSAHIIAFILILIISVFVGNRPMDIGTDTWNYYYRFSDPLGTGPLSIIGFFKGQEPVYVFIILFTSIFGGFNLFLGVMCFLMNSFYYISCILLSKQLKISPLWPFLLILTSFTCWNQQINIVRSGVALALCFIGLYFLYQDKYKKAFLYTILSAGIHISIIIVIISAILVKILSNLNLKYYIFLYIATVSLAFLGYSILSLLIIYAPDMAIIERHTVNIDNIEYKIGFRVDFVLYNTLFLIYFVRQTYPVFILDLLKLYILLSGIFFLWFALPFSDRVGAYSWMLIPFLLSLSNKTKTRKLLYSPLLYIPFLAINFII